MPLTPDEAHDPNLEVLLHFYPGRELAELKTEVERAKSMRHTITRALQNVLALSPTLPSLSSPHPASAVGRRAAAMGGGFVSIHITRSTDNRILQRAEYLYRYSTLEGQQERLSAIAADLRWLADRLPSAARLITDALRERFGRDPSLPAGFTDANTAGGAASDLADLLEATAEHQRKHTHMLTELLGGDWEGHQDPLGCYWGADRKIELFWPEIALCAALCHVTIEALAIKVLTHELAHALTDAGLDTSQNTWSFASFSASHRHVKEGLAQFFTLEALRRSNKHALRDAEKAFHALLPYQSIAYRDWQRWLPNRDSRSELIRQSLVAHRRHDSPVSLDEFMATLQRSERLHLSPNADPDGLAHQLMQGMPRRSGHSRRSDDHLTG